MTFRPPEIPLVKIPKLLSKYLSHRTAQPEGHNRCTLYAVHTEVALGIEQRQCWGDRQLLCEQDDGVVVTPAGMWELNVIVTQLQLIVRLNI